MAVLTEEQKKHALSISKHNKRAGNEDFWEYLIKCTGDDGSFDEGFRKGYLSCMEMFEFIIENRNEKAG